MLGHKQFALLVLLFIASLPSSCKCGPLLWFLSQAVVCCISFLLKRQCLGLCAEPGAPDGMQPWQSALGSFVFWIYMQHMLALLRLQLVIKYLCLIVFILSSLLLKLPETFSLKLLSHWDSPFHYGSDNFLKQPVDLYFFPCRFSAVLAPSPSCSVLLKPLSMT